MADEFAAILHGLLSARKCGAARYPVTAIDSSAHSLIFLYDQCSDLRPGVSHASLTFACIKLRAV
jgi:hypothetical protein